MLDVFLTVDVEIWCDGWTDLDARFPDAYQRHILGRTPRGDFGLPFKLRLLAEHGLTAVFFTEPLFSTRFGAAPLQETVSMLRDARQEVQLHLHTEWVDESTTPLLPRVTGKRQHMFMFDANEQAALIKTGLRLLTAAGAPQPNAFRAGSFGFNRDTLRALAKTPIRFDSSYNAGQFGRESGVMPGVVVTEPVPCEGISEYPLTVFSDGFKPFRNVQVTACSFAEMEGLLWQATERKSSAFVLLSHSFELLNQARNRPDPVAIRRFSKLCDFLARHRNVFNVRGFHGLTPRFSGVQPPLLTSPRRRTFARVAVQALRRAYR